MNTHIKQAQIKHSTTWGASLVGLLRAQPLWSYFFLAYIFTWAWMIPMFLIWHQQVLGPWLILSPSLAGFVMAGITEGRAGVIRLLRRALLWRIRLPWYLVTLLLMPAIWLVSVALMPGAIAAFRLPSFSFLVNYLIAFVSTFFATCLLEEFGWRGFALPGLQRQHGPLLGTLILGFLWGFWHLPLRVFQPGDMQSSGTGWLAFAMPFFLYVCETAASAVLFTWIFNHSRGSILLALLLHASNNATGGIFPSLFPSLFPRPVIPTSFEIGVIVAAVIVIVATRGRLGYDQYQRQIA
jgi:membrane protease YdiL (CAAX protease family)